MTKLVWGQLDQKRYETGVDRGVLYPSNGPGVVWNGLVSVEESYVGGEVTALHFEGIKYLDLVGPKNFRANITAFSAPKQFLPCIGEREVIPGFILTRQPRVRFGFSYRTLVGDSDYKIHLVYNAFASPNGRSYKTFGTEASAETRSWTVDAVPPLSDTYRPSAHFVVESRKMEPGALQIIEMLLYGTEELEPRLPPINELIDILAIWDPRLITVQPVSGLSELVPGLGDLYKTNVDGIFGSLPTSRLYKHSSIDGLYRLE